MDIENQTDEEIVDIVRTSNKEMYVYLVRRYENKLTRYVFSYLRNEENTHDVVQATFIKAYENINSFNVNMKFSSWIYRIAHNEALNKIKKEHWSQSGFDPELFEKMAENTEGPDKIFEAENLNTEVKKCFDDLPEKFRDVLNLYYLEEKKYDEISDILRIPTGTVATWINRGKKLLKEKCQNLK